MPAVGDVVSFDVFTEKRSNRQGATAVRLLSLNPAGRQRGTVSVLKEGYGFMFKGWVPAWTRLQPTTILIFLTLEQLKNLVDVTRKAGFDFV